MKLIGSFLLIGSLTFLFTLVFGQNVIEIHTKTGANPMDEGFGQLSVTLYNALNQACNVPNLDEDGNYDIKHTRQNADMPVNNIYFIL